MPHNKNSKTTRKHKAMKVKVNRKPKYRMVRRKGRLYLETVQPARKWRHWLSTLLSPFINF